LGKIIGLCLVTKCSSMNSFLCELTHVALPHAMNEIHMPIRFGAVGNLYSPPSKLVGYSHFFTSAGVSALGCFFSPARRVNDSV
jgi:hypothetical protein